MKSPRDAWEEYLREAGRELTGDREEALDAVFDIHHHFTSEELAGRLGAPFPNPELEDVLGEMAEAGLIRKVFFGTGPVHYEHVYGHVHHDHLYCVGCGKVVEFRNEAIERLQTRVAEENGFHVLRHNMQIVGLCADCQKRDIPHGHEYVPTPEERGAGQVPLSLIRNGERVRLVGFRGGPDFSRRLADMGLKKGDRFHVVNNTFAGPLVVKVKDTRLAIGHGMAHRILVRLEGN